MIDTIVVILNDPRGPFAWIRVEGKKMKIIDACSGKLQTIPFELGERGRERWLEEVKVSNRPGQTPDGPEDVGYFCFGGDRKHVILTKSDGKQRGILLRINTAGAYTKGSYGSVELKGGDATLLTSGKWAEGAAGRVANGPDQLWHVKGPAIFVVVLQGGTSKGYGKRYLVVTPRWRTIMIKPDDLAQIIATDDDPDIVQVIREFVESIGDEGVSAALKTAETLETDSAEESFQGSHYVPSECPSLKQLLQEWWSIAIPAVMQAGIGGVSSVQSGTLMPGEKEVAVLLIGSGGGKRYRFEKISETGLTRLRETCDRPYTRERVLATVDSPNWHSAWVDYRDGEPMSYTVLNAGGCHEYWPGEPVRSREWPGHALVPMNESDIRRVFGLDGQPKEDAASGSDPVTAPAVTQEQMEAFRTKFGK
ncbi:MAG: hypothetical protein RL141_559 [Candidatus Parcubacteria bacterium]|jgi:hypothetical protein